MARRRYSSSSEEDDVDYSRRRTDRKTQRRRRSPSSDSDSKKKVIGMEKSRSEDEISRKRGRDTEKKVIDDSSSSGEDRGRRRRDRKAGERVVVRDRNRDTDSSSDDDEVGRRRDRKVRERDGDGVNHRKLDKGEQLDKSRKGVRDSSSDEEIGGKTDRKVRERGDVDDRRLDKGNGIKGKRVEETGREGLDKSRRGRNDSSSDEEVGRRRDRKVRERGDVDGMEDGELSDRAEDVGRGEGRRKERILGREKESGHDSDERRKENGGEDKDNEIVGRAKGRGDEGHRNLGGRDDEKRVERHRTGRGSDDGDEKRHRRRDEGNRNGGREDRDDGRKERRRDDRDDGRKERRNDRVTRKDYDDEKDRRRSDREDRRNDARTEVERDNKSGREKEEGGGNVKEDPRAQRPEGNVNIDMANLGRSGGVYIPPFKLARMLKEVEDKSSTEYQRMTWDALRKSINGLVNKVNSTNAKNIIPELFAENLIRGRGLFCRSCMKSQMASPGFTDVFSALVAVVNTKFPEVGDLLLRRIILQLQRAFKRNDKPQLLAAVKFIAHLVNQQVVHELIALELLTLLLRDPTDDSVEVAVGFVTECGAMLQDLSPRGLHAIFERFRGILHEGEIDKRVQFLIEGLFALRKAKFQNYPAVRPELDLVELEDQITHEISLSAEIDPEISLDIFKPDPQFLENEKRYEDLKKQILGEESEEEDDDDEESGAESDEDSEEDSEEEDEEQMRIRDETETNLVNLRRTIYLTIMSSVDFEEAGHKLLKIKLEPGQEMELCIMLLECCSQERTYLRYYGLLGQRFCMINKVHQENFEKCFVQQYSMIHRLETNKLRNVAKFFAHLLGTDALPWHVLAYIRLTEEDTTSSSRIFIKILFQELSEHLGIRLLNERLTDPSLQESFDSIFPKDNPKNTRFAINFFTSIGLGGITENLREYLKNMPRLIMQQQKPPQSESEEESSSSDSSDSGSSSSSSSSESESDRDDRRKRRRR